MKKFKKMASAVQSTEANPSKSSESTKESTDSIPAPSTSIPTVPIPTVIFEKHDLPTGSSTSMNPTISAPLLSSQFPLKHSALSMLAPSAQPVQTAATTIPLSSKVYVPAPSPSPHQPTVLPPPPSPPSGTGTSCTSTLYGEEKTGFHMKNGLSKDKISSTIKNTGKIDS